MTTGASCPRMTDNSDLIAQLRSPEVIWSMNTAQLLVLTDAAADALAARDTACGHLDLLNATGHLHPRTIARALQFLVYQHSPQPRPQIALSPVEWDVLRAATFEVTK